MKDYPLLDNLMGGYFNQDADLITGSTELEGMIDYYLQGASKNLLRNLISEMDDFQTAYSDDLDKAFCERYPGDLDMSPVGEFFDVFRRRIQTVLGQD
ncbi:Uncharacterised protein [Serratia rubidaea]|uniref:CdiI immunity protein domain-containing protein n=1 Tax=Serratia rubidaea TaxID=61652 RepID=A0A448SBZ0_SERRU|nr:MULTISPECIES: contact-dependent growth inhibition system immunity protein [Serratia]AGB84182.1 hypothetical protein D781_3992 [Serratia sp. FGI94]MBH1930254.1 hypothetical protein [Serratia rubidaea]MCR0997689.1 contact-dependent growth inhibition system immunity protein [Serratia rubidaea]MDC6117357.1 contact-dependent growth inhibition system immunity protein [Serratia rubidaea]MEB7586373.1 contact-dependent growth inhibition system immunity protein [Serratia rubidaea]